jgi:6-phosphogluconolactonase
MKNMKSLQILVVLSLIVGVSCKQSSKSNTIVDTETADLEVLVGAYTNDTSEGIYKLSLNPKSGEITKNEILVEVENPSYLDVSEDGKNVYAVQENKKGMVFSYQWNADKTKLIEVSSATTNGMHPCYVSVSDQGNLLAVGNYSSGNLSFYQIEKNGKINDQFQTKQHQGSGTLLPRQESPHVHSVKFYKNNFLYAVDLGIDKVMSYPIENGVLGKGEVALNTSEGDGLRHVAFHPSNNIVYLISEFTNAIIIATIDAESGVLTTIQKVSSLPDNYAKESFAADIHISNDGRFLYASNRGHNSIAVFSIATNGTLTFINHTDTMGSWPRNFALSKDNKFLLVANQHGNNVTVFKRDEKLGTLMYTGHQIKMSTPVFLKFL